MLIIAIKDAVLAIAASFILIYCFLFVFELIFFNRKKELFSIENLVKKIRNINRED